MKIVVAMLLISPLLMASAAPASAQGKAQRTESRPAAKTEDLAKKKADEEAYQRALKNIPEPKGKPDPWSGAR